jgi:hypothetical protein
MAFTGAGKQSSSWRCSVYQGFYDVVTALPLQRLFAAAIAANSVAPTEC